MLNTKRFQGISFKITKQALVTKILSRGVKTSDSMRSNVMQSQNETKLINIAQVNPKQIREMQQNALTKVENGYVIIVLL